MAISIKREKNERGVTVGSLKVGDTFMYDDRIGVIVDRNGHCFPMDFATCATFYKHRWTFEALLPQEIVLPVEVELTYKVVG